MPKREPLARSSQLTPLSHDHYDGLLFAWRTTQGLKKGADLRLIRDYINWFWDCHLCSHFEDEEKWLLPQMDPNDEMKKRVLREHAQIRELIPGEKMITGSQAGLLAELVHDHIRFEERELFPFIEKSFSTVQLDGISAEIKHHNACLTNWTREFWKE